MTTDERVEQIRRANASWMPKPQENPSAFHAKNDIAFLLTVIDELRKQLGHCQRAEDEARPVPGFAFMDLRTVVQPRKPK